MLDVLTATCLHFVNPMMHCTLPVKEPSKPYLSPDPVSGSTMSIYRSQFLEAQSLEDVGKPHVKLASMLKSFQLGHHFKFLTQYKPYFATTIASKSTSIYAGSIHVYF